jgi:hypothetical protein
MRHELIGPWLPFPHDGLDTTVSELIGVSHPLPGCHRPGSSPSQISYRWCSEWNAFENHHGWITPGDTGDLAAGDSEWPSDGTG